MMAGCRLKTAHVGLMRDARLTKIITAAHNKYTAATCNKDVYFHNHEQSQVNFVAGG